MKLLSECINIIKVHRRYGKKECKVPASKLIKNVLKILKDEGYIKEFEYIDDKKSGYFIVKNFDRINDCGYIRPVSIGKDEIIEYEKRFLPSRELGIIILSTSKGVLTNKKCKELGIGGKPIAYFY